MEFKNGEEIVEESGNQEIYKVHAVIKKLESSRKGFWFFSNKHFILIIEISDNDIEKINNKKEPFIFLNDESDKGEKIVFPKQTEIQIDETSFYKLKDEFERGNSGIELRFIYNDPIKQSIQGLVPIEITSLKIIASGEEMFKKE